MIFPVALNVNISLNKLAYASAHTFDMWKKARMQKERLLFLLHLKEKPEQQQLETLSRWLKCFIIEPNANLLCAALLEIKGHQSATYIVMSCFHTSCFKWLNKYCMPIMRLCYCCLTALSRIWSWSCSVNAIHYSPLKIAFIPMPLFFFFQNLCLYWHVSSPDQQTLNMTPLNGHILTPKIHPALSGSSSPRAAVPQRWVYRSCRLLTGTTLPSQSARTHPCTHTLGYPQTNTGERSCKIPWELPWGRRCQPWPAIGAAWLRLSLHSPLAGPTLRNKEWEPVSGAGALELIRVVDSDLTAGSLSAAGLALCAGGKRKRVSG